MFFVLDNVRLFTGIPFLSNKKLIMNSDAISRFDTFVIDLVMMLVHLPYNIPQITVRGHAILIKSKMEVEKFLT